ncbi:MAG: hypothetical protein JWM57_1045 [Phycisphaerales bacterium]|nr:hypothetical protein [Phycisphaerales bacterium]
MPDVPSSRPPVTAWFGQPAGERLAYVVDMMRELSRQTEPADAVRVYGERVRHILNADARISLSRRDLTSPQVRVTSSPKFSRPINAWTQREQLPLIEGGILSDLIWAGEAVILNDFRVDPNDPAAEHLADVRSLSAIPLFDGGEALNMILVCRHDPGAFTDEHFPENVWLSNLFGRSTGNLVTRKELQRAYDRLDRELRIVADIQRSLLPTELPKIAGIDVAAYYNTSEHAGGDFYDFFELPDGKLGIFIADVSGHGTPAAVIMAVTHAIAHTRPGQPTPPAEVLAFVNRHLCARYTNGTGTFVTAFYGVFDPKTRELHFASAGHNPPRLKRAKGGPNGIVESSPALPLGIDADEPYHDAVQKLEKGDTLLLYTDGITEARSPDGELFGTERLDAAVSGCCQSSQTLIDSIIRRIADFSCGLPASDDQTLLVIRV